MTMKQLLFVMTCACFLAAETAQAQETASTWTPGTFVAQSLNSCFDAGQVFLTEADYGYDDDGISLVGTYMQPYEYYSLTKFFDQKESYIIIAAGDEDATDVDLRILNANSEVIAEDNETDRIAIVEFTPRLGADFMIEVELYDANVASFVSFIILRKGGWTIPRSDFEIAQNALMRHCETINQGLDAQGRYLKFNDGAGHACLFGGLIPGDGGTLLTNLSLGEGDAKLVAAGDSDVEDIDLVLYDENYNEMSADRLLNAQPVIDYFTLENDRYHVELLNEAAEGSTPTYCIVGLLQVRP